jgi:hypothetical protein
MVRLLVAPPVMVPVPTIVPAMVSVLAPADNVAPLLMVSGEPELIVFDASRVMMPVLAIITPPVAANGVIHSAPALRDVAV